MSKQLITRYTGSKIETQEEFAPEKLAQEYIATMLTYYLDMRMYSENLSFSREFVETRWLNGSLEDILAVSLTPNQSNKVDETLKAILDAMYS